MNTDYRMLAKGLHFCTCQDTSQANEDVKAVKDDIVIIGKEQETYYYDEKTKLWNCCTREVYGSFIPDFYEQSGKNLMSAYKKYTDEDDADNDQLLAKVRIFYRKREFLEYSVTYLCHLIFTHLAIENKISFNPAISSADINSSILESLSSV
jgi:hypothetical protein